VIALFAAWVWLFGLLNDRLNAKADAVEAENVGQAKAKAERLVKLLGTIIIYIIHCAAWISGLFLLPAFMMVVYLGVWLWVPVIFVLSAVPALILNWTERTLKALDREP
jgi:hypothetical protein